MQKITTSKQRKTKQNRFDFLINFVLFSYRRLALKFHPAKNANDQVALNKFYDLAEAYDVLSDRKTMTNRMAIEFIRCLDKRRAIYDQYGDEGLKNGVPIGKNELNLKTI